MSAELRQQIAALVQANRPTATEPCRLYDAQDLYHGEFFCLKCARGVQARRPPCSPLEIEQCSDDEESDRVLDCEECGALLRSLGTLDMLTEAEEASASHVPQTFDWHEMGILLDRFVEEGRIAEEPTDEEQRRLWSYLERRLAGVVARV